MPQHPDEPKSGASSRRGSLHIENEGDRDMSSSPLVRRAGSAIIDLAVGILSKHKKKQVSTAEAECLEHIRNSEVLQDGWLTKCGGSVRSWKRRWFILVQSYLCYAKEKNDTEILGAIPLTLYSCVDAPQLDKSHAFKLQSEDSTQRTYLIHASSAEEKVTWMTMITNTRQNLSDRQASGDALGLPEPLLIDNSEVIAETPDFAPPTPVCFTPDRSSFAELSMPPPNLAPIADGVSVEVDAGPPPPALSPAALAEPPASNPTIGIAHGQDSTSPPSARKMSPRHPPPPPPSPCTR
ncbi:pleckstrin homology domain-containing family A member 4-like [Sycon ciliatum]|uniref:pleckstrin homology domain-containing family A member 4-like n=1 Tax=Sycon ciliatum TaxID=27933 RepID=UPI0031F6CB8F